MRSPALEIRSRHEQFPPNGRLKAAVCEHAPNHGRQNPLHAFERTDLLRRVRGGELLDDNGLQAVLPELLPGVLTTLADVLVAAYGYWHERSH